MACSGYWEIPEIREIGKLGNWEIREIGKIERLGTVGVAVDLEIREIGENRHLWQKKKILFWYPGGIGSLGDFGD